MVRFNAKTLPSYGKFIFKVQKILKNFVENLKMQNITNMREILNSWLDKMTDMHIKMVKNIRCCKIFVHELLLTNPPQMKFRFEKDLTKNIKRAKKQEKIALL